MHVTGLRTKSGLYLSFYADNIHLPSNPEFLWPGVTRDTLAVSLLPLVDKGVGEIRGEKVRYLENEEIGRVDEEVRGEVHER